MWPFRKTYAAIDELPSDDWVVGQGEFDGQAALVRCNRAAQRVCGHPGYPFQVGVAVPLNRPRQDGLPDQAESDALETIEDTLTERLEAHGAALLTVVVTTNGARELVFYAADAERSREVVERLDRETTSHALQLVINHDPKWRAFKMLKL